MRKMDTKNDLSTRNEGKLVYLKKLKGTEMDYSRIHVWRSKRISTGNLMIAMIVQVDAINECYVHDRPSNSLIPVIPQG